MLNTKEMQLQAQETTDNIKWMKPDKEETAFQELERVADFLNGLRDAFYNSGYNDNLVIGACRRAVKDINAACDKFISTTRPEDQEGQTDTARDRDREEYTVAFMHGVKCLAEDLAAGLPAGSGREALKSILKTNYDYTDQDIERFFS